MCDINYGENVLEKYIEAVTQNCRDGLPSTCSIHKWSRGRGADHGAAVTRDGHGGARCQRRAGDGRGMQGGHGGPVG
jgi:hypothetical protein